MVRENSVKTILLAAGAAAIALSAGHVLAQGTPKQPIPYSQLNAYLKGSPKQRAAKDWSAGQASASASATAPLSTAGADTGAGANTSATAPAAPSPSLPNDTGGPATSATPPSLGGDTKGASLPSTPPIDAPAPGAVNPSPTATPGAPPSSTPPK